jgi:hypothetical protein
MVTDLMPIVRRSYPTLTDLEVEKLVTGYADEGCAYMALANTLFEQYLGRETEFEVRFGFPLRKANNDFNFEMLVIDFYCSVGGDRDGMSGLASWNMESYWEKYLGSHDMYVDVHGTSITPKTWAEVSKGGHIIVSVSPVNMYKHIGGELIGDERWRTSAHAMIVTGVTEEGYLIVSSWGERYYINPNDPAFKTILGFISYQQVSY